MRSAFDGMKFVPTKPDGDPNGYSKEFIVRELDRCIGDSLSSPYGVVYFIKNYIQIFNNDAKRYVPFELWDSNPRGYDNQLTALKKLYTLNRAVALKARQVGATTEIIAYFLYEMLFRPKAVVLILSRGEKESKEQLKRIKEMFDALPKWMKSEVVSDTKEEWALANGSVCYSLSSHKGDSFSATHVLIDEADLLYRSNISLQQVLLNLAPTVGQRGKLFIISKVDKSRPESTFKKIYKEAARGRTEYAPIFIPYHVVPGRTPEWYEREKQLSQSIDGTLDYIYETYPSTPDEALAPLSANTRFKKAWLDKCYKPRTPIVEVAGDDVIGSAVDEFDNMGMEVKLPLINGLRIYELPVPEERYIISGDPAEGLASSDDSACSVMKISTRQQVAVFAEKIEPTLFAFYLDLLGVFYNHAVVLFELNEHGRTVKNWLQDNSSLRLLKGWAATERSRKTGWTSNSASKPLAYHEAAERFKSGDVEFYDELTYDQLSIIESGTNAAPKGMHDDMSMALVLNLAGIAFCVSSLTLDLISVR